MLGLGSSLVTASPIEVESGWLKCTYGSNQTDSYSGISRAPVLNSHTREDQDYYIVTYDIYLHNPGGGDYWEGTDTVRTYFIYGGYGTSDFIDQDTNFSYNETSSNISGSTYQQTCLIKFQGTDDNPQAGAIFFLKNVIIRVYKQDDTLKDTYTSDFTSDADDWVEWQVEGSLNIEYNKSLP